MKKTFVYLCCCMTCIGLWTSCGSSKKTATIPAEKVDPVAKGEKIYSQNCQGCHTHGAPDLTKIHETRDEIIAIVTNGKGKMPNFKTKLSEPEIVYVAEYVLSLGKH